MTCTPGTRRSKVPSCGANALSRPASLTTSAWFEPMRVVSLGDLDFEASMAGTSSAERSEVYRPRSSPCDGSLGRNCSFAIPMAVTAQGQPE